MRPVGALLPPLGVGRVALRQRGRAAPSPIPLAPSRLKALGRGSPRYRGERFGARYARPHFFSATALCLRVVVGAVSPLAFLAGFASPAPAPIARHLMTFFVGYRHVLRA